MERVRLGNGSRRAREDTGGRGRREGRAIPAANLQKGTASYVGSHQRRRQDGIR